jgi:hypothetical protein
MKASEAVEKGLANIICQYWEPDGSVTVYVWKRGWEKAARYRAKAKKPGGVLEVLEDEEVEAREPRRQA